MIFNKEEKESGKLSVKYLGLNLSDENMQQYSSKVEFIKKRMTAVSQVDICFCCDVTGSMDIYIDTIKNTLAEVTTLLCHGANIIPRIAFLGFRDLEDEHQFVGKDFTLSVDEILDTLCKLKCYGGGDACEDVVGALIKATKLKWKCKEKYLILIVDAPTHGLSYHDPKILDDFPNEDKAKINLETISKYYSACNIELIVYKCSNSVDKMISVIDENYKFHDYKKSVISLQEAATQGAALLAKVFASTCSESISTKHASTQAKNIPSSIFSGQDEITWNDTIMEQSYTFAIYMGTIVDLQFTKSKPIVQIGIDRIVMGAYMLGMRKIASGAFKDCYQFRNEREQYIAKIYNSRNEIKSIDNIRSELDAVVVGDYFARKFNELCHPALQITFLDTHIVEVSKEVLSNNPIFRGNRFFIAERFMKGKYVKYNNNCGWINAKLMGTEEYNILQAFSHFSFCYSLGNLIIVDIQGTKIEGKIHLTDPVIHSDINSYIFGKTNGQSLGISQFFQTHECNIYCHRLNLIKLSNPQISKIKHYVEDPKMFEDILYPLPSFEDLAKAEEEKKIEKPKSKKADVAVYVRDAVPSKEDMKFFLLSICPSVKDFEIYTKTGGGILKTTVFVYLEDPSIIPDLIQTHDSKTEYNGKKIRVFVPEDREKYKERKRNERSLNIRGNNQRGRGQRNFGPQSCVMPNFGMMGLDPKSYGPRGPDSVGHESRDIVIPQRSDQHGPDTQPYHNPSQGRGNHHDRGRGRGLRPRNYRGPRSRPYEQQIPIEEQMRGMNINARPRQQFVIPRGNLRGRGMSGPRTNTNEIERPVNSWEEIVADSASKANFHSQIIQPEVKSSWDALDEPSVPEAKSTWDEVVERPIPEAKSPLKEVVRLPPPEVKSSWEEVVVRDDPEEKSPWAEFDEPPAPEAKSELKKEEIQAPGSILAFAPIPEKPSPWAEFDEPPAPEAKTELKKEELQAPGANLAPIRQPHPRLPTGFAI